MLQCTLSKSDLSLMPCRVPDSIIIPNDWEDYATILTDKKSNIAFVIFRGCSIVLSYLRFLSDRSNESHRKHFVWYSHTTDFFYLNVNGNFIIEYQWCNTTDDRKYEWMIVLIRCCNRKNNTNKEIDRQWL